jgi:hypothetical protein
MKDRQKDSAPIQCKLAAEGNSILSKSGLKVFRRHFSGLSGTFRGTLGVFWFPRETLYDFMGVEPVLAILMNLLTPRVLDLVYLLRDGII